MSAPVLDHVIILVPQSFLDSPPSWLSDAFTLYPGGKHVDGATQNTLVLLPDGSYLEFIAFVPGADPALRQRHRWGHKHEGTVVDWALTLVSNGEGQAKPESSDHVVGEEAFARAQQQVRDAHAGIVYSDLAKGGRKRLDGVELKWAISSGQWDGENKGRFEPGQVPFWCLDSSPRNLRVPYEQPDVAVHASGVTGVAHLEVQRVKEVDGKNAAQVYDALFENAKDNKWKVGSPSDASLHQASTVSFAEAEGEGQIKVSFYTKDPAWAGKSIGGKVGDYELRFELGA
ncbi:hypothetical protein HJFPF1_00127 [Paramyrothecium foliicola]|nr:hypothetical protein HJFPF1_00127 [Paramyrothecium foliicola]